MPEITPDYFWENFTDHEGKLSRVHMLADFMQPKPVGSVAEHARKVAGKSRSTQKQKLRGLYVDYRKGKIQVPGQIGERAARNQIKQVGDALASVDMAFSVDNLDLLFQQFAALSGGLRNVITSKPDAVAAALQLLSGWFARGPAGTRLRPLTIPDDMDGL
jgi:hypothetical protein